MKQPLRIALCILLGLVALLAVATLLGLEPLPARLTPDSAELKRVQVRDRRGIPLSVTYGNDWNLHDLVALARRLGGAGAGAALQQGADPRILPQPGPL